jgi:predicted transposase/invertase (TIGR01784 family)
VPAFALYSTQSACRENFKKFSIRLKQITAPAHSYGGGTIVNNHFIPPLADFMVKEVFGHQKVIENTAAFLKAVLDLNPKEYRSLRIVNPNLRRRWRKAKAGTVDIRINTVSGKVLHIEAQARPDSDMRHRTVFYQTGLVSEQIGSGDDYWKIQRTISIVIANYVMLPEEAPGRYRNTYQFLNTLSHRPFTDLQEVIILELPKVPEEDDGSSLWPRLQYFKCRTEGELSMLVKKHPEMERVVQQYRRISPLRRIRIALFEYEDAQRIRRGRDRQAREEGFKEAEAKYEEQLTAKEEQLADKEEQLADKDGQLTAREEQLAAKDERIRQLEEEARRLREGR